MLPKRTFAITNWSTSAFSSIFLNRWFVSRIDHSFDENRSTAAQLRSESIGLLRDRYPDKSNTSLVVQIYIPLCLDRWTPISRTGVLAGFLMYEKGSKFEHKTKAHPIMPFHGESLNKSKDPMKPHWFWSLQCYGCLLYSPQTPSFLRLVHDLLAWFPLGWSWHLS